MVGRGAILVVQTSPLVAPEASGLKEGGKSEVGTVSAPVKPMSKGNVLGRGIHPKVVVLCVSRLCFGAIIEDLFRDIPAFRNRHGMDFSIENTKADVSGLCILGTHIPHCKTKRSAGQVERQPFVYRS